MLKVHIIFLIGMAVYNVFIVCAIGVPVALFGHRSHQYEFCFYVITSCIVFCTTLTLCLVFVPKVCFKLVHQLHVLERQLLTQENAAEINFFFKNSSQKKKTITKTQENTYMFSLTGVLYKCSF